MIGKPNNASLPLTRRSVLRSAAQATGAIFMVGATTQTAVAAKLSQQVVAYQNRPAGDKSCNRCVQFQPPSACKIVDGTINPGGYCKFFTPRGQA